MNEQIEPAGPHMNPYCNCKACAELREVILSDAFKSFLSKQIKLTRAQRRDLAKAAKAQGGTIPVGQQPKARCTVCGAIMDMLVFAEHRCHAPTAQDTRMCWVGVEGKGYPCGFGCGRGDICRLEDRAPKTRG